MGDWKPDRILKALVGWIAYMLVFSWLPLVRILFDGESYQWGTTHFARVFSAAGWGADAWLLVFKSALLIGLLVGALRGANAAFRWALLLWSTVVAADVVYQFIQRPDGFEFHGDTLGIHLNLGWVVVAVTLVFTGLAVTWVAREILSRPAPRRPIWTMTNSRALGAFLALTPVQFFLLRLGEAHGATDAIGVVITILSVPFLAWALWPRGRLDVSIGG